MGGPGAVGWWSQKLETEGFEQKEAPLSLSVSGASGRGNVPRKLLPGTHGRAAHWDMFRFEIACRFTGIGAAVNGLHTGTERPQTQSLPDRRRIGYFSG